MVTKLNNAEVIYNQAFAAGLALDPEQTINQWADENRIMSTKEGGEPGKWRTSRTPYLKEIMECLSPSHPCERVVFMKGAQIGATEVLINWIGYVIDKAPGPFLMVQPTTDMAGKISKQRLAPAIEQTPCMRQKIRPAREKDSGNTVLTKEFAGGIIMLVGANSEAGLRSMPIRFIGLDEIDMYPGFTISKAEERSETFTRRKIYLTSTPKQKNNSHIEDEYRLSDQRKYYVPCPSCGTYQVLVWDNIKFQHEDYVLKGEPEYLCKHCGVLISEHQKPLMLERGKWIAENKENGQYPGFHLAQFYSTLGKSGWKSAVNKFLKFTKLKKQKIPTYIDLQETWTNDVLGETWESVAGESANWEILFNRRENLTTEPIDSRIAVICSGVDVQDDRIEIQTVGFAKGFEPFIIEYKVLYGKLTDQDIWAHLDQYLLKTFTRPDGLKMRILGAAIDTQGHYTDGVYEFVKTRYIPGRRYIFGIQGASAYHQPIINQPSKNKGIYLFSVGTDTVKDLISRCLQVAEPGSHYIHFPLTLPEAYFHQLCSEKLVTEWTKGKKRKVWKNTSKARNEALDTLVYAIAALNILRYWHFPNNTIIEMLDSFAGQIENPDTKMTASQGRMINEGERIE